MACQVVILFYVGRKVAQGVTRAEVWMKQSAVATGRVGQPPRRRAKLVQRPAIESTWWVPGPAPSPALAGPGTPPFDVKHGQVTSLGTGV